MTDLKKRPTDINQRAKLIVDIAVGDEQDKSTQVKDLVAVESGRRGGLKGGRARAEKLTPDRRKEIAKIAARKRWRKAGDY